MEGIIPQVMVTLVMMGSERATVTIPRIASDVAIKEAVSGVWPELRNTVCSCLSIRLTQ